jgi:hypothetical protein
MTLDKIIGIKKNDLVAANRELECDSRELNLMIGWNDCIDELSKRRIDREKLAKNLYNYYHPSDFDKCPEHVRKIYLEQADAILTSLPDLVVKGEV